ncbi:hypothetical protein [Ornithinimicrobium murale]|uniref:hypothetical protein n=1 Tax=Ornithinimicrobium murale TaxID=1050153 RepID=UPI0013B3EE00|nr:hypothetical protein [Ornithinimicrobium murale]
MPSFMAVHLKDSYPTLAKDLTDQVTDDDITESLEHITLGVWANVSDTRANDTEGVLGVYKGAIVSAYQVTAWERNPEDERIRFHGHADDSRAHLIGTTVQGGPWVRGQSNPTRQVDVPPTAPAAEGAADRAAVDLIRADGDGPLAPRTARFTGDELLERVMVRRDTRNGGIIVEVPSGTRVAIHPTKE